MNLGTENFRFFFLKGYFVLNKHEYNYISLIFKVILYLGKIVLRILEESFEKLSFFDIIFYGE